jgi:phage host-nuclease inhibitor protein Gam
MKKRIKMPLTMIANRDEAEAVMNELALAANEQRTIAADRDERILAINRDYEADLVRCEAEMKSGTEALRLWAEGNPDEFPRDKKSMQLMSGTVGFRTGAPRLALLSRAWTWEKVLGALQTLLPDYVRSRPEVNKEAILSGRAELESMLPKVGVKVMQDETFYVEPNLSELKPRQSVVAC